MAKSKHIKVQSAKTEDSRVELLIKFSITLISHATVPLHVNEHCLQYLSQNRSID